MKANELRVGNIIKDEFIDPFKKIIVVESINEKGINLEIENSNDYPEMQSHWIEPYYSFDELRGIPLTEEWLLRLGFESCEKIHPTFEKRNYIIEAGIFRDGKYWMRQIINNDDSLCISPELWYVHQLQNLYFALTGEELTIVKP